MENEIKIGDIVKVSETGAYNGTDSNGHIDVRCGMIGIVTYVSAYGTMFMLNRNHSVLARECSKIQLE